MTRKYTWTVQIEIDGGVAESLFAVDGTVSLNDADAYDLAADGTFREVSPEKFRARSLGVRESDHSPVFGLQWGPVVQLVK